MEQLIYIIIAILGGFLVFVLLSIAKLLMMDNHLELSVRRLQIPGSSEIRLELKGVNKGSEAASLIGLSLTCVSGRKATSFAEINTLPITKKMSSLTDSGIDKEKRFFLNFPAHGDNAAVLTFHPNGQNPISGDGQIYLSCLNRKYKRIYAKIDLGSERPQSVRFKRKPFVK